MQRICLTVALALGISGSACLAAQTQAEANTPLEQLLRQFETEKVFWRQVEVAEKIIASKDTGVLSRLKPWLSAEDRHIRGNAALIFGGLGDPQGFEVISAILRDYSPRPQAQGVPGGNWNVRAQIRADRYYAAHLLGDLKDPRGVPVLVSLVNDPDVSRVVPWALSQIGEERAIQLLIQQLSDPDASIRVLTIHELSYLKAVEALPELRKLLGDNERANFGGKESVAEAAKAAISELESQTAR
jgi:HEAT repeat protein